jgi:hypothetical protein
MAAYTPGQTAAFKKMAKPGVLKPGFGAKPAFGAKPGARPAPNATQSETEPDPNDLVEGQEAPTDEQDMSGQDSGENEARAKYQATADVIRKVVSQFPIDQKVLGPAYASYEESAQEVMPFLAPEMQTGLTSLLGKYKALVKTDDGDMADAAMLKGQHAEVDALAPEAPPAMGPPAEAGQPGAAPPAAHKAPFPPKAAPPAKGPPGVAGAAPDAAKPPFPPKAAPPAFGAPGQKPGGFPPKKKFGGFGGGGFKKKFGFGK